MGSKQLKSGSRLSKEESEEMKANYHEFRRSLQAPEKILGNQKRDQSKNGSGEEKSSSLEVDGIFGSLSLSSRMTEERHLELVHKKQAENFQDPDGKLSSTDDTTEAGVFSCNSSIATQVEVQVEANLELPECIKGKSLVSAQKTEDPQETKIHKSNVNASNNKNRANNIWQLRSLERVESSPSLSTSSDDEDQVMAKHEIAVSIENDEREKRHESDSQWADIEEEEEGEGINDLHHPARSYKSGKGAHVNRARFVATSRRLQRRHNAFRRRQRFPSQGVTAKHLRYFLSFLFYSGMSPLKPTSAKRLPTWVLCLQAAFYWLFTIISTVGIADEVKFGWINFRANEGMFKFVIFWFFMANCITKTYNIYLLYTSSISTSNVVEKIEKMNTRSSKSKPVGKNTTKLVVCCIGTVSVVLAGVNTIFGDVAINEWSIRNAITDRSYEFSNTLYVWTADNHKNVTDKLFEDYGYEVTLKTGLFAAIGNIICFFSTLHGCLILDLFPILTLQIYFLQKPLSSSIRKANTQKQGKKHLQINWKYYMSLRSICDDLDDLFGDQMKLIHIQNLLLFGYSLLRILNKDPVSAEFLIDLFSIVKVSITYYYAKKIGDENGRYEDHVTECSNRATTIIIDGKEMDVSVLIDEMKKHPIGIGRDEFFINKAFINKWDKEMDDRGVKQGDEEVVVVDSELADDYEGDVDNNNREQEENDDEDEEKVRGDGNSSYFHHPLHTTGIKQ